MNTFVIVTFGIGAAAILLMFAEFIWERHKAKSLGRWEPIISNEDTIVMCEIYEAKK